MLFGLARRGFRRLLEMQRVAPRGRVKRVAHGHQRRAGLIVPAHERGEISARDIGKAADELFHRAGLAIVAFEIEIHALAEFRRP
ncbi:MAG: hypothetical protein ACK56F_21985, partial [bacterium]